MKTPTTRKAKYVHGITKLRCGCTFGAGHYRTCKDEDKIPAKPIGKVWKPTKNPLMLNHIKNLAYKIYSVASDAQLANTEKRRDKHIEHIMRLTEKIEDQYTKNWH